VLSALRFVQVYMVASTVSFKMIAAMARKEGFHFVETLTGFKWIGNKAADLRKEGNTVLFSYEEAIGFCVGDIVKVSAASWLVVYLFSCAKWLLLCVFCGPGQGRRLWCCSVCRNGG
jgi:phosphomannomutase